MTHDKLPHGSHIFLAGRAASGRTSSPTLTSDVSAPAHLTLHRPVHTLTNASETAFTCPVPGCGRTYTVKSNMRRHMRSHDAREYQETSEVALMPVPPPPMDPMPCIIPYDGSAPSYTPLAGLMSGRSMDEDKDARSGTSGDAAEWDSEMAHSPGSGAGPSGIR